MMNDAQENVAEILTERVTEIVCSQCGGNINVAGMQPFTDATCPECSNAMKIPARLGNFLLLDLVGMGGMGGVYVAQDMTLGRLVAIKVMLKSLGQDAQFIETFRREAQSVARLNHPNIAQIYSFGEEGGQPYIVMELVSGSRFDKMVEAKEPMDQGLVMRIGLEIAQALQAASELGLIHSDIKPENILLDEKMSAKLVDFGLASYKDQAAASGVWGTPYYIAPEKIRRQKVDERSDIYSLGGTLFHALTGRPPFEGTTPMEVVTARLENEAPTVSSMRPDIHPDIDSIIKRMMEQSLTRRYPNYKSLISDLQKIVKALGADKRFTQPINTKIISKAQRKNKSDIITLSAKTGMIPTDGTADPNATSSRLQNVSARELDEYRKKAIEESSKSSNKFDWKILAIAVSVLLVVAGAVGGGLYIKKRYDARILAEQRVARTAELKAELPGVFAQVQGVYDELMKYAATVQEAATKLQALDSEIAELMTALEPDSDSASTDSTDVGSSATPPPAAGPVDDTVMQDLKDRHTTQSFEVQKLVKRSKEIAAKAKEIETKQTEAVRQNDAARESDDPDKLAAVVKGFKSYQISLAGFRDTFKSRMDEGLSAVKEMEDILSGLQVLKKKQDALEKAELEQAAKVKAEQELKEKAETEQLKVAGLETGLVDRMKQFEFDAVATELKGAQGDFTMPEAKAQLTLAIDKTERMGKTHAFVVQSLKRGLKGGYVVRGASVDVVGADEKGIKLKPGKPVEWKNMGAARYAKLLDRCIAERKAGIRERAELNFGAALMFRVFGAEPLSQIHADKARELPTMDKLLEKMLPPLPAAEPAPAE